jgi:spore coat protein B
MNFNFMSQSVGRIVQLERGGPDKIVGELVGIRDDHLVLRTKEHGVLYCASHHVKSVTEPIVYRLETTQSESEEEREQIPAIPIEEVVSFTELLGKMQGHLVQINHSGPQMLKGVLYRIGPDSVTLVYDMKEYIHYSLFHIRSISRIYEFAQNQDKQGENDKKGSDKQGEEGKDKKKGK